MEIKINWFWVLLGAVIPIMILLMWGWQSSDEYILLMTYAGIIWYAEETRRIKLEMQEQTEAERRPIIDLYLLESKDTNDKYHFIIKNEGKQAAYNIEIEEITINGYIHRFYIDEPNTILAPHGDQKKLELFTKPPGGGATLYRVQDLLNQFFPQTINEETVKKLADQYIMFLFRYDNVAEEKFFTIFKLYVRHPVTSEYTIDVVKRRKGKISTQYARVLCEQRAKRDTIYR